MKREWIVFILILLLIGALGGWSTRVMAQAPITKNQLQAAFSQGYAAGVQSQVPRIQELEDAIAKLEVENKALKEK